MFECHITNGITNTGLAIRHFGYSLLKNPKRIATAGMIKRSERFDKEIINYYLPFGTSTFEYKDNTLYQITLPGFNIFFGSIDFLINLIKFISSSLLLFIKYFFLSKPIPCSAEIDPSTSSVLL